MKDQKKKENALEEILQKSNVLERLPMEAIFTPDTMNRLTKAFGYDDEDEEEEEKRREAEHLRKLLVIWLLAREHWQLEGITEISYERMRELSEKFAEAIEDTKSLPETAALEAAQDIETVRKEKQDALESWITELEEEAMAAINQEIENAASYSNKVRDVLDQNEWLGILQNVTPVRPLDPQQEKSAIQEIQLGVIGVLTASYSNLLIRNKDHVYDAELARQNFDGNAEQFAASREFSQMVTSMPGRDAWEKAMNLRKLAEAGGGENITNEFKRLRDANRKQQKTEAAAQPEKAKEMGLSK